MSGTFLSDNDRDMVNKTKFPILNGVHKVCVCVFVFICVRGDGKQVNYIEHEKVTHVIWR